VQYQLNDHHHLVVGCGIDRDVGCDCVEDCGSGHGYRDEGFDCVIDEGIDGHLEDYGIWIDHEVGIVSEIFYVLVRCQPWFL